ncbi:MAG: hypothetical protein NT006_06840 [Candidatus Aminicenantes bacterium]|nr:hypothetical protein [Candidatus Aminicenantes bacterium]
MSAHPKSFSHVFVASLAILIAAEAAISALADWAAKGGKIR